MVTAVFTRPPDVPDSLVREVVESAWLPAVESIDYLPVGFGSHHWLVADGLRRWFVTVDAIAGKDPTGKPDGVARLDAALSTARQLHDHGLSFVVAPIAATNGNLLVPIDSLYVAALYPYVPGTTFSWGPFPDRSSRLAVLDRLVALHAVPLTVLNHARADEFEVPYRIQLEAALADTANQSGIGVYTQSTRRLLSTNAGSINARLAQYDRLTDDATRRLNRPVVTHGEPHRANTIVTDQGVVLVDWDTALIALPERDLWWLAREDVEILAEYESQTDVRVDLAALDAYRLRWDLTDIASFTVQLLGPHDDDEDARTASEALATYLDST
jgi:hypothetical protein